MSLLSRLKTGESKRERLGKGERIHLVFPCKPSNKSRRNNLKAQVKYGRGT